MKKNYKYIAAIFLGGLIGFSACTDDFESYNTKIGRASCRERV